MRGRRWVAAIVLVVFAAVGTGCMTTPDAGEVGVVRNGGPFDNHKIRQIVDNGSGNTWNGWFSETHYYPADTQQRFFKMQTCHGDGGKVEACEGADAPGITVPTSDGVEVNVEGTFYLQTVFSGSDAGHDALKAFDTQFATRTFDGKHAYEGAGGWSAFLGAIVEPIVANNLRETISQTKCADLLSSCALVQNQGNNGRVPVVRNRNNQSNIARIQSTVERNLRTDLYSTLGRTYFQNIKFSLRAVTPPPKVADAIEQAQASFAQVSQAQAKVKSADLESKANEKRQRGYRLCPTCARIDAIRALPRGITALGGNFAVGVK